MSSTLLPSNKQLPASNSAEKLKKKRKKKKTKQRSASSGVSFVKTLRGGNSLSRSATSCPPIIDPTKKSSRTPTDPKPANDAANEVEHLNENLRWLSMIAVHSRRVPSPGGAKCGVSQEVQDKLAESIRTMSETPSDEEERLAIYKMNRRKRYLAERQDVIDRAETTPSGGGDVGNRIQVYNLASHQVAGPMGNNMVGLSIAT